MLVVRHGDIDELRLRGAGRTAPVVGGVWLAGAVGLIGIPYVGVFLGHSLLDDGAIEMNVRWLPPLLLVAQSISAGALLRAGARVFLGWGPADDPMLAREPPERPAGGEASHPLLLTVTTITIGLGLVASIAPGLQHHTENAAERFRDHAGYVDHVLHGVPIPPSAHIPFSVERATSTSLRYGFAALALSCAVAAAGLWYRRLPSAALAGAARLLVPPVRALHAVHSGIVGDYVLWLCLGTVVLGGVWAFTLR